MQSYISLLRCYLGKCYLRTDMRPIKKNNYLILWNFEDASRLLETWLAVNNYISNGTNAVIVTAKVTIF
jgi:hypothetical protein